QVKCLSVSALDKTTPPGSPPSSSPSLQGGGSLSAPLPPPRGHRRSVSCGSAFGGVGGGNGGPPLPQSDCRIIRVRMELDNGSLYKSILVTPQDKTPAVVARALEKQGQDPAAAPHFQLLQLLPQNRGEFFLGGRMLKGLNPPLNLLSPPLPELLVPPNANVFYAMSSSSLDFQLRDGREQEEEGGEGGGGGGPKLCHPLTQKGGGQLSGTFPKMKAKGRRITR
ncbi:RGL2 protein, partial [Rhinopomastus cyanomelas]|nr:RGL2 protein [Rhinopomastus cyanomelas]